MYRGHDLFLGENDICDRYNLRKRWHDSPLFDKIYSSSYEKNDQKLSLKRLQSFNARIINYYKDERDDKYYKYIKILFFGCILSTVVIFVIVK